MALTSRDTVRPVLLAARDESDPGLAELARLARTAAADVPAAVALARDHGRGLPRPGDGATVRLWEALATLGATDLTVARVVEPHLDALAILEQARAEGHLAAEVAPPDATWGVYAAEGPGVRLRATAGPDGWVLDGTKPWCSVPGALSDALVTAWDGDATRRLYAVRLTDPGVRPEPGRWAARGLSDVDSSPVTFAGVAARPVGDTGWYLDRPGFAWGGMGVAAVWFGAAVAIARRVRAASASRPPDQLAQMHLGACDGALVAARAVLTQAAGLVDGSTSDHRSTPAGSGAERPARLALRVRMVTAGAAETVLHHAAHALGPGPLATEEEHARRVADLQLYLRQWHAERDIAALGADLLEAGEDEPW